MPQSEFQLMEVNGEKLWVSRKQFGTLGVLQATRKGGCASVIGYRPTTGYVEGESPVQDIQFISRFSTEALYERRREALEALDFATVAPKVTTDPKLAIMPFAEVQNLFESRRADEIASIEKTQAGDRSDSRREAHDRCYRPFAPGIVLHLKTAKRNGIMEPVYGPDGEHFVVGSIMLGAIFLNVTTREEGTRKVVNSREPKRMSNIITAAIAQPGTVYRRLALKDDNFDELRIDGEAIVPEELICLED